MKFVKKFCYLQIFYCKFINLIYFKVNNKKFITSVFDIFEFFEWIFVFWLARLLILNNTFFIKIIIHLVNYNMIYWSLIVKNFAKFIWSAPCELVAEVWVIENFKIYHYNRYDHNRSIIITNIYLIMKTNISKSLSEI